MGRMSLSSGVLTLSLFLGLSAPWFASAVDPTNNGTSPIYPDKNTTLILIKDPVYGTRNVSYWLTDDGLAIIDGDVIYGPIDDLLSHSLTDPHDISKRAHSVFAGARTWPGATITYNFDSADTETKLSAIVNGAIGNWKIKAPYLQFKKIGNSPVGQIGVVTIKNVACGGCYSAIGFSNTTPLTMNLQQACPSPPGSCGVAEATHEFGHLLGLYHEHQRFDRESFVHYECKNLDPLCPTMPVGKTCCDSGIPSGCCSKAGNFAILSGASFDASGVYDVHSIMQYRANAFARPSTNTLTSAAPGIVVPSTNPSAIDSPDSKRICKLYKHKCPLFASCLDAQCPSHCVPIKGCNKPSLCNDPKLDPPPCCEPVDPETCQRDRDRCSAMGCNIFL